jgi:hypothetical protein
MSLRQPGSSFDTWQSQGRASFPPPPAARQRHRLNWRMHLCFGALLLLGLWLLAPVKEHASMSLHAPPAEATASQRTPMTTSSGLSSENREARGAGGEMKAPTPPGIPLPSTTGSPTTTTPQGSCISPLGGIDWGACWSGIWSALSAGLASAFAGFLSWLLSFGFMFITPAALTYRHGAVVELWGWSLSVADAALALLLVIGGYNALLRHTLALGYHTVLELLPRLLLALVAAHASLTVLSSFIDLANALCTGVLGRLATAGAGNLLLPEGVLTVASLPVYIALAYLLTLVMSILLAIQMLVRLALLDLLLILSPIWLLLLALPQTARYARLGAQATAVTLLVQWLQDLTLVLGSALVASFGHATLSPITLLVGLSTLYLAWRLPTLLSRPILAPMEEAARAVQGISARALMVL